MNDKIIATRRAFLFGTAATIAAAAIPTLVAKALPIENVVGILRPCLKRRKVLDLLFSSAGDPPRDETVNFTFYRNETAAINVQMNARASFRWVAAPKCEIVTMENDIFKMVVDNCQTNTSLTVISNIDLDHHDGRMFSETYRWEDNKLILSDIIALDPKDSHLLEEIYES